MKILDLVQGSDQWLEARLNYLCASEAPAMMGCSKFMSRNQLLDLKKGWRSNPDSGFKKRLYEKGHEHEDTAREITEIEYCENFPAIVGLTKIDEISVELLSSFDGFSSVGAWEHKDWNETLSENVRNGILEPLYYWQLEHQMLTAGHDKILFTCSDGTQVKRVSMIYESVPERRDQLISGWKQFIDDLDKHEIKAKQETVIAVQTSLPVITFSVTGTDISTNIGVCLDQIKEMASAEMSKILETDQDFADKDQLNKDVKKARAALKEIVGNVRGEFVSYSQFEEIAQEMDSVLQQMQSHGEKQVKQAKEAKKHAIWTEADKNLRQHIAECDAKLKPMLLAGIMGAFTPDWAGAMKNKRTVESLENAVSEELAKWKIAINQIMGRVVPNLQYLRDHAADYKFLFHDAQNLVDQDAEPFQAIIKSRIADHQKAEAERLEAERQRIQKEEEAKAQREAEAKAEADRERIREEERAKAQAEERAKRDAEAREEADRLLVENEAIEKEAQGYFQKAENDDSYGVAVEQPDFNHVTDVHEEMSVPVAVDAAESNSVNASITKALNPELFELFKELCTFDTSGVPKHGKGFVNPEVSYDGVKYRYDIELIWDYSWGIEEWCDNDGSWDVVDENESNIPSDLLYDIVNWSIYYGASEESVKRLEEIISKYF